MIGDENCSFAPEACALNRKFVHSLARVTAILILIPIFVDSGSPTEAQEPTAVSAQAAWDSLVSPTSSQVDVGEIPSGVVKPPTPATPVQSSTPSSFHVNEELLAYGERVRERNERAVAGKSSLLGFEELQREGLYILALIGVLGGSTGPDIYSGPPPDEIERLVQERLAVFNQPGSQLIDPGWMYREVFIRLLATDMGSLRALDQVAIANAALSTVEIGMPPDSFEAYLWGLDRRGSAYYSVAVTNETDKTYPEYLNEFGLEDAFD